MRSSPRSRWLPAAQANASMRRMIQALMLLLLCQLAGELAARVAAIPVPGPVLGMLLLFALLLWRARLAADVRETTQGLLRHLSLLFVPAGVGVINHFGRIRAEW